jgi:hypothetical protein
MRVDLDALKKKAEKFANVVKPIDWTAEEIGKYFKDKADAVKSSLTDARKKKPYETIGIKAGQYFKTGKPIRAQFKKLQDECPEVNQFAPPEAFSDEQLEIVQQIINETPKQVSKPQAPQTPPPSNKVSKEEFFKTFQIGIFFDGDPEPLFTIQFEP